MVTITLSCGCSMSMNMDDARNIVSFYICWKHQRKELTDLLTEACKNEIEKVCVEEGK